MNESSPNPKLTLLDSLICAYLALPLLLFCAWFKWPVAIGFAMLLIFGFLQALSGSWRESFGLRQPLIAMIAGVALVWTALAGVGHFFYANLDWITRDAVLRDLTATAWPPQYPSEGHLPLILRAPVGYYLPAATIGSLLGLHAADLALYLWTASGFTLFLCAVTTLFSTARHRLIAGILMMGFGGLDLIGTRVLDGSWPHLGQHIEWWADFAQYSSNSTLLFWVPNHALPAWLGLVLVLRHWRQPGLARISPLMAAAIPLWSPLSAVGLAPFFLAGLNWPRDFRQLLSPRHAWPLFVIALIVARYLTMNTQAVSRGWAVDGFMLPSVFWTSYGLFCALEFGLLTLVLIPQRVFDLKLCVALVILLTLPFFRLGPGNDLVMRCSIPALTVLALAAVRPLVDGGRTPWRYALIVVLAIGVAGAAQEPERALLRPRWEVTGRTLVEVSQGIVPGSIGKLPEHYVGNLDQPGLALLMRTPSMVRPDAPPP